MKCNILAALLALCTVFTGTSAQPIGLETQERASTGPRPLVAGEHNRPPLRIRPLPAGVCSDLAFVGRPCGSEATKESALKESSEENHEKSKRSKAGVPKWLNEVFSYV